MIKGLWNFIERKCKVGVNAPFLQLITRLVSALLYKTFYFYTHYTFYYTQLHKMITVLTWWKSQKYKRKMFAYWNRLTGLTSNKTIQLLIISTMSFTRQNTVSYNWLFVQVTDAEGHWRKTVKKKGRIIKKQNWTYRMQKAWQCHEGLLYHC